MDFAKIAGSGNDFVLLDNRDGALRGRAGIARAACRRKLGIGADGLILLESSRHGDFRMRIFNPDGSEAEMCGNGLRCLVRFIREIRASRKSRFIIETGAGPYETWIRGRTVRIRMRILGQPRLNIRVPLKDGAVTAHIVDTGVPHLVVFVEDLEKVDVSGQGPQLRYHRMFRPRGTNVDWVQVCDDRLIRVRTYERGVEAETLACGTGVTACAAVGCLLGKLKDPVRVLPASGEEMTVSLPDPQDIFLEGLTTCVFRGSWPVTP